MANSKWDGLCAALLCLAWAGHSPVHAEERTAENTPGTGPSVEEILVRGEPAEFGDEPLDASRTPPYAADAAELLDQLPGGAAAWNGPVTGEVQLRGMTGTRVGVQVGGMEINSGGPNRMDPPLHYAPRPLLESLDATRGIASVRDGSETVGGRVRARLKRSRFAESPRWEYGGELSATGKSVDDSIVGGGIVHGANDQFRWHVLGSLEDGGNTETSRGLVSPTHYRRSALGGGAGVRLAGHALGVEYRRHETEDAGTPPLPMDIQFFETDLWRIHYDGAVGGFGLAAHLSGSHIDHRMNNFQLRAPPTDPARFRFSQADATGLGFGAEAGTALLRGVVRLGFDGHRASHDQRIHNPNNAAFFVRNFNAAEKDRYGLFVQWNGPLPAPLLRRLDAELGVRYTLVRTDAGRVDATPANLLPPPMALRDAFNAADRSRSDHLVDAVVKLGLPVADGVRLELAGGRKTRAPHYIERYAWLPLEVTGGLADGNVYVGDIELEPEVYYEVEGGVALEGSWYSFAPRAFYRHANDFIQGLPSSDANVIATAAGIGSLGPFGVGVPLQYSNVAAVFYGVDADWALRGPYGIGLEGLVSWVRGRRRDAADELYRVAPLRTRTTLHLTRERWRIAVEGIWVARQKEVARSLGERRTDGYGVVNFLASVAPTRWVSFDLGLENAFDAPVRYHLGGINRVANSAVPPGARLPGRGRGFFGRVRLRW